MTASASSAAAAAYIMTLADVFTATKVLMWLGIGGLVLLVLIVALGLAALQWPGDR